MCPGRRVEEEEEEEEAGGKVLKQMGSDNAPLR